MINNYGNCSNFKICNENDEFFKQYTEPTAEKDYRQMVINTPPSNAHKSSSKYLMVSTHNGLFSCTPKDLVKHHSKEDLVKTTMFN